MIKLKKRYQDLDTAVLDVIDKYGDVFEYEGAIWQMVLRSPSSDEIQKTLTRQADEASRWRARQAKDKRDAPLPSDMAKRHGMELLVESHVEWINAPVEGGPVDFQSAEFAEFLEENGWYFMQWQKAWLDLKNFREPMEKAQKATSSAGAKDKSD